ncbi:MAG: DUF3090 family protein [Nocardioides sp.]|uniref:DUF3090 family protein n=1 Tax=Nocardioides sp. TaxID=35761 RepID=UPI0039E6E181
MAVVFAFDPPERFVAGTVGEPGARTFFLQARSGSRLVSVALEKQQVAALAERLDELLDELMSTASGVVPAVAPYDLTDNDPLEHPIEEEFRAGTMTLSWDPHAERVAIEVFSLDQVDDVDEADEVDEADGAAETLAIDETDEEPGATDRDDDTDDTGDAGDGDRAAAGGLGDLEDVAGLTAEAAEAAEAAEMLLVKLDPAHARAFVQRAGLVVEAGRPSCPFCGQPIDVDGHLCVRANGFRRRDP